MREFPSAIRRDTETTVQLDDTRLLLAFKEPRRFEDLSRPLREVGLVFEHDREDVDGTLTPDRVNHTDTRFWVSSADGRPIDEDRYRLVLDAFGPELDWVGPVYRMPDSYGREGLHTARCHGCWWSGARRWRQCMAGRACGRTPSGRGD